ncbi:uncharacterized protein LOC131222503 isoform X2 [Magnolia sinica]|uniref:uncharacterized protein LOC131222503 isoform X2 n=1 Tax=Magnolia sinica TaxID=86752 RepID=UPI00265AFD27|nr:uncharacterized protein LOC131222503 isoform X2 [Magnolia sinica]
MLFGKGLPLGNCTAMEKTCIEQESESSSVGISEVPGEPAIVINGVPNMAPIDGASTSSDSTSDSESEVNPGFGEWLEGRGVRKMFGDQYYSGKVVKFDAESNWYRVVYEDDDFEDLEWQELQEVLLPLDIAIPLEALALKIHKYEKSVDGSEENASRSRKNHAKNPPVRRRSVEAGWGALVSKSRERPSKEHVDGLTERRKRGRPRKEHVDGPKERRTFLGNTARAESQKRKQSMIEYNTNEAKSTVLNDS